jgi:hypothetical protein
MLPMAHPMEAAATSGDDGFGMAMATESGDVCESATDHSKSVCR